MRSPRGYMRTSFVLTVLIVLLLTYNNIAFAQVPLFSDLTEGHWARNIINNMAARGYILGYPDNSFSPEKEVTREEFAVLLVRCMGISPAHPDNPSFIDVPAEHWSASYIEAVKEYLPGYALENGHFSFMGAKAITREDVTAALVRAKGGINNKQEDVNILAENFKDYSSIASNLKPFVAAAIKSKLISGFPDGTFRPNDPLTRAQAAAFLYRAFCRSDSVIKNMINVGDISPSDTSDKQYEQLARQLNNAVSLADIDGENYGFTIYVKDVAHNSEQLQNLIYIFANSNAPFSFEAAKKVFPEHVQKYMEGIKNLVEKYYPGRPLFIMTGFTKQDDQYWWMQAKSLFEGTDYKIVKNDKDRIYRVEKFFSGLLYVDGNVKELF